MLYILDLNVQHTLKEHVVYENETTGSVLYTTSYAQNKIVEAADEAEAKQKVETFYASLNNDVNTYNITVTSISDTII